MPNAVGPAYIGLTATEIAREEGIDRQVPIYFARRLGITPIRIVGTTRLYSAAQVKMIRDAIAARSRAAKGAAHA